MTTIVRGIYFHCMRGQDHGTGQTYRLDAYVSGPIHPETGIVINLKDLDLILKDVIQPIAGKHLNLEVKELPTPSSENVLKFLHARLKKTLSGAGLKVIKTRLCESDELWLEESDV